MKMTVAKKLLGGFLSVLLLLGAVGIISFLEIGSVNTTYSNLMGDRVSKVLLVENLQKYQLKESNAIRGYLITGNTSHIDDYHSFAKKFDLALNKLADASTNTTSKSMIHELGILHIRNKKVADKEIEFKQQDDPRYLDIVNTTGNTLGAEFSSKIEDFTKYQETQLHKGINDTTNKANAVKLVVVIISLAALAVGSVVAFLISRSISKPVIKASKAIEEIAEGNLAIEEVMVKNKDEIGLLVLALNKMKSNMRMVIHQVMESSAHVASSSAQLAASADQSSLAAQQIAENTQLHAAGTEQQLARFQEVSSSVGEMAGSIQQIASGSETMLKASEQASNLTNRGAVSVNNVVNQINLINESVGRASVYIHSLEERSRDISKIVTIITGIADQTNLLALNAAIEAARAGEMGKGFAVVADEVRKLAEESKKSADQITQMIGLIQQETKQAVLAMEDGNVQVSEGLRETTEASSAFNLIATSINEVSEKVEAVSSSVQQLAASSDQIMEAVMLVKEISEQNAAAGQESSAATEEQLATMEEVSSSAESLSKLAEELQTVVSRFKL